MTEQGNPGHRSTIKGAYEIGARDFNEFAQNSFTWEHVEKPEFSRVVTDLLSSSFNGNVLDAACGAGRVTGLLARLGILAGDITGVDASEKLLALARKQHPDIHFMHADITELDLPDSFDLITSHMALVFLDDRSLTKALRRFYAHMHEGGTLYYMTTHPLSMVADGPMLDDYTRHLPIPVYMP